MSTISQIENRVMETAVEEKKIKDKTKVSGKTIGEPKLSETAKTYYEELKKKYSNMDFILVSSDMKETAKSMAGSYANSSKMVVLIDEEKIERMAVDEDYRKQYEQIISNASIKMPDIQSQLSSTGVNVKSFGIQVNDNGTASYFAVVDGFLDKQRERIEKKTEENREAKKEENKKRLEEIKNKDDSLKTKDDTVTVTASSVEELISKINNLQYGFRSDFVLTEEEKLIGSHIDYRS